MIDKQSMTNLDSSIPDKSMFLSGKSGKFYSIIKSCDCFRVYMLWVANSQGKVSSTSNWLLAEYIQENECMGAV